jgi:hypothetical protein
VYEHCSFDQKRIPVLTFSFLEAGFIPEVTLGPSWMVSVNVIPRCIYANRDKVMVYFWPAEVLSYANVRRAVVIKY